MRSRDRSRDRRGRHGLAIVIPNDCVRRVGGISHSFSLPIRSRQQRIPADSISLLVAAGLQKLPPPPQLPCPCPCPAVKTCIDRTPELKSFSFHFLVPQVACVCPLVKVQRRSEGTSEKYSNRIERMERIACASHNSLFVYCSEVTRISLTWDRISLCRDS